MVVRDFNLKCISMHPFKDDSPLIINSNAVKIASFKFFKSVSWRNPKIIDRNRGVDMHQFPPGGLLYRCGKFLRYISIPN